MALKRYAMVHFIGDTFMPERVYEYRLPKDEVILSGMHVAVPAGPNGEIMRAVVVSRHRVRRYWFGKIKTIRCRVQQKGS